MSKSRKPGPNRGALPAEKLRPAVTRRQKFLLAIAALLLAIWLIVLIVLAII